MGGMQEKRTIAIISSESEQVVGGNGNGFGMILGRVWRLVKKHKQNYHGRNF